MLHASPMSSAALLPFIRVAAEYNTVIAPDTPGYGWSDPLVEPAEDLAGYVTALYSFTRRLGLETFGLYGTATGAQIAIEFSKTYGARVDYLILDNAAHFTDEERDNIVSGYFPDLTPDATGSHLTRIWSVARDQCMFFPWHQATPETRLPAGGVNTGVVHQMAMEFLQAGKDYDRAYRAAFANEKMERVRPLTVPVIIMRWQGSILKSYTDRFDSVEWPENFTMLHKGPGRGQRIEAFRSIFTERLAHTRAGIAISVMRGKRAARQKAFSTWTAGSAITCRQGTGNCRPCWLCMISAVPIVRWPGVPLPCAGNTTSLSPTCRDTGCRTGLKMVEAVSTGWPKRWPNWLLPLAGTGSGSWPKKTARWLPWSWQHGWGAPCRN